MHIIPRLVARPVAVALVGLSLLVGATSCSTTAQVGVSSDFDHSVNFRAYRTWAWYPQQVGDTDQGAAPGYESFIDKRMRVAVENELAKKGMTYAEKNPDVYVAYSARVEDKQSVTPNYGGFGWPYYGYGYGGFGRGMNSVVDYKAGTVVIDFVDAQRKELAWRGTGQAQVSQQSISEQEAYRIVGSILGNYPPQDNSQARR